MDADAVRLLGTPSGQRALAVATAQADPSGLAAVQALRRDFSAELTSVALTQVELRRRAVAKFGATASSMFFTRDGLEQATRPEVAAHHAARFVAAGVTRVVDLGCGIGSDALALVAAGLEVIAVEIDPGTAEIARLNLERLKGGAPDLGALDPSGPDLGGHAEVLVADADTTAAELLRPGVGVFCDPARRSSSGRLWRVEDFTPSWALVETLLGSEHVVGVKLGPALPHALVPPSVEAEWVSSRGDTVEVALWSAAAGGSGRRAAMVLPGSRLEVPADPPQLETAGPRRYVYEPDGAVIRAGGVTSVGELVHGALLDPKIAYLTSDTLVRTPFASEFEVVEVLPYQEKAMRRWLRDHQIGSVEIKKRGIDIDPAQLRRRLGLQGPHQCTLILTRTPRGALAIVARRPQEA